MGSSRREQGRRSNETLRQVRLQRPFAISKTEVTNELFRQFRAAHNSGAFGGQTLDAPSQPVVNVSWQDAAAFCNWLSVRQGLPPAYVEKGGTLVAADPTITLPRGRDLELWFAATNVYGCHAYDSNESANYHFTIE